MLPTWFRCCGLVIGFLLFVYCVRLSSLFILVWTGSFECMFVVFWLLCADGMLVIAVYVYVWI